jgi:hypothetical protein
LPAFSQMATLFFTPTLPCPAYAASTNPPTRNIITTPTPRPYGPTPSTPPIPTSPTLFTTTPSSHPFPPMPTKLNRPVFVPERGAAMYAWNPDRDPNHPYIFRIPTQRHSDVAIERRHA